MITNNIKKYLSNKRVKRLIIAFCVLAVILPTVYYSLKFANNSRATVAARIYWGFNEGTGTTAYDSSNNSNSGSISGATWVDESRCFNGKCLSFDGVNDSVSKTYSSDTELDPGTGGFSISAWFRHPSTAPSSGTHTLISRFSGAGYKVYMNTSGYLCFGIDADSTWTPLAYVCSATSYADSKWHFVEAVKNANTSILLYIDGQSVGSTDLSSPGSLSGSSPTFYVGIDSDGTSNPWSGFIDEVKYLDGTRSTSEVLTDYSAKGITDGASITYSENQKALSDGLVGYWKMDETSGNLTDSSGNGNTGNVTGTTVVSGKFASGRSFNGTSDYAATSSTVDLTNTHQFSVSFWMNWDSYANDDKLAIESSTNYNNNADAIIINPNSSSSGGGYFEVSMKGFTYLDYNFSRPSAGVWHHYVFTFDDIKGTAGNGEILVFVDGKQQNTSIIANNLNGPYNDINNYNWYFMSRAGSSLFGNGDMDEIRIYNRSLSPAEAQNLYNWAPGPVGYWKFDENTGTTAYDVSGNNKNISLGAAAASPKWVPGKLGSALQFDGTNDTANSTSSIDLSAEKIITVEFWLYWDTYANDDKIAYSTSSDPFGGDTFYFSPNSNDAGGAGSFVIGTNNSLGGGNTAYFTRPSAGTWHHYAAIFNQTAGTASVVTPYVDGVAISYSKSYNQAPDQNGFGNYTHYLMSYGGSSNFAAGKIDDLKIYNYVRTPSQIIQDMNAGHPAPGSPVGSSVIWYKFDEGRGDTIYNSGSGGSTYNGDLAGSGTNCTVSPTTDGCPTFTSSGINGYAATTAHSQIDFIDMGDIALFDGLTNMTISFWVNPTSLTANYILASKTTLPLAKNGGTQNVWALATDATNTDEMRFYIASSLTDYSNYYTTTNLDLAAGTWSFLSFVYDGTQSAGNRIKIYKNGRLVNGSITGTIPTSIVSGSTSSFQINASSGVDADYFSGSFDDFKIYTSALSADQVLEDYNQGKATVLGSASTSAAGAADNSAARSYCPPGNVEGSCASGQSPAPIEYFPLDENTGQYGYDFFSSVNGADHTMTLGSSSAVNSSDPTWVPGKIGSALSFDGTNDYTFNSNYVLQSATKFTWSLWAKFNGVGDYLTLISDGVAGGTNYISLDISDTGPGHGGHDDLEFCVANGNDTCGFTTSNWLTTGVWYHLEAVYDGTESNADRLKLYVNGVAQSLTPTDAVNDYPTSLPALGKTFMLGATGGPSLYFNGILDDVRVYSYARTAAQVAWDYNRGAPLVWYKFDECTGATLNNATKVPNGTSSSFQSTIYPGDSSGNNDSTGSCSTPLSDPTNSMWYAGATGKFNSSVDFDGTNDYASTNSTINLSKSDVISVAFWLNWDSYADNDSLALESSTNVNSFDGAVMIDPNSSFPCAGQAQITYNNTSTYGFRTECFTRPSAGTWHHWVAVFDYTASGDIKIYIDGILQNTTIAGSGLDGSAAGNFGTYTWYFMSRAGSTLFGGGKMDDFRLYNYGLSANQVKTIYNEGSAIRLSQ